MFDGYFEPREEYNVSDHLAQMTDLFGPLPEHMLAEGNYTRNLFNLDGQLRQSHTRMFSSLADILRKDSPLHGEARVDFLAFLSTMLNIDPKERKTAAELLEDPWLNKVYGTKRDEAGSDGKQ